jgi:general secretion pathway protein I
MSKREAWGAKKGFTLVEALVALAVFAIGLTALVPMVVSQIRGNEDAAVRTEALAFAQERIEELRVLPYQNLAAEVPGNDTIGVGGIYTREWAFIDAPPALAGDGNDLSRIRVTVKWQLPRGGERAITLVTSRASY